MSSHVTIFPQCAGTWSAKAQATGGSPKRDKGVFLPRGERDEAVSNQLFLDLSSRVNHSLPTDYAGLSLDDCSDQAHLSMYCISATLISTDTSIIWRTTGTCETMSIQFKGAEIGSKIIHHSSAL